MVVLNQPTGDVKQPSAAGSAGVDKVISPRDDVDPTVAEDDDEGSDMDIDTDTESLDDSTSESGANDTNSDHVCMVSRLCKGLGLLTLLAGFKRYEATSQSTADCFGLCLRDAGFALSS
jgi:hypothetical protein